MKNDLNTFNRCLRLIYRASRTQWGVTIIEGSVLLVLLIFTYYFLILACVGLHGQETCFNQTITQTKET